MPILAKGSKVYSIFGFKCPRCNVGDLYFTSTFSFNRSFDMHPKCPHCGQPYELEAGFYYGAMFMSYLITAFLMFSIFGFCYFMLDFGAWASFILITGLVCFLYVWIFRLSRSMWLSFFVKYESKYDDRP